MRKYILILLCGIGTSFAANRDIGIDRIHDMFSYNNISRGTGWHLGWFGYRVSKGIHQVSGTTIENSSINHYEHGPRNLNTTNLLGTFDNDLKNAFLDKDRYDTYLSVGRYIDAWQMGLSNAQGTLWRERAVAEAKKDIEKYTRRSIFEQDTSANVRALSIVNSFAGLQPHQELHAYYQAIQRQSQDRYNALMANPQVAALSTGLQAEFARVMFSEN